MRRLFYALVPALLLAAPSFSAAEGTYVVRKGDSLGRIARNHGTSILELKAANGLNGSRLSVGMELAIPGAAPEEGPKEGPSDPARGSRPQLHTVQRGDTLRSVARTYDVPERDLRRLNHFRRKGVLKPGSQLVVREAIPLACTVEGKDTLERIARRYHLDADALMDLNRLAPGDELRAGQQIALVGPEDSTLPAGAVKLPTEAELAEIARAAESAAGQTAEEPLKDRVIRVAERMLSVPYRWGGETLKGLDCSAYVRKVFAYLDLELPRSAREQFREGVLVDKAELSIGDLVFFRTYAKFPSHVGIYLGDNRFIHASSRDRKVKIDNLEAPYYVKRFIGAKRLLFEENEIQN
ncbi:MAG: endopeptidase LytE [Deltaproteobacteria bacterium]|nr:endopeptidase LytE [Deltaproteobacteria bacterium]